MRKQVALLTSRYWEGAFALAEFIRLGVPCAFAVIHKTWWRSENSYDYSPEYLHLARTPLGHAARHLIVEELASGAGIHVSFIENVNEPGALSFLPTNWPIVVVGSPIIKKSILESRAGEFINLHTGLLPEYRGPYSEFWALFNERPEDVGTTIHLIDEGIDSGPILDCRRCPVSMDTAVAAAHVTNATQGITLLAEAVLKFLAGLITPKEQDRRSARYYSWPSVAQIQRLEQRTGLPVTLNFAD